MPWDSDAEHTQADMDNHSDQMNPNNDAYWDSRGFDGRPDDWDGEDYDSYIDD